VVGAELANAEDLAKVMRADLNDLVVAELIIVHVVVSVLVILPANVVHVELLEDLCDNQIENGNDIGGVILYLPVKHLIELEDMVAIDVKHVAIQLSHFLELLDVVRRLLELLIILIVIIILDLLKVVDKVFEFHLDVACVDVSAPKHLRVRAHLGVGAALKQLLALVVHHAGARGFVVGELDVPCTLRIEHGLVEEAIDVEEAALLLEV